MESKKEQKKKNTKIEKVILRIIVVLSFLIILIISLITLASTVMHKENLSFGTYKFYIMKTDSQEDIAKQGDLVIVKQYKPKEVAVGDSIVYYTGKDYHANKVLSTETKQDILNIVSIKENGIIYKTEESKLEGKVIKTIHNLGTIIYFLRTVLGTILFFLIVIALFITLRMVFIRKKEGNTTEETHTTQTDSNK